MVSPMKPDDQLDNSPSEQPSGNPYRAQYRQPREMPAGLHVDLDQDWELQLWTRHFGCTEAELHRAVKAVGNSADDVRAYLRRHKG